MFGALSIAGIPIQLTPDITEPTITVSTFWPGATPTEIESEILDEQEEALKSLPGLVRMTSEARRENGTITLELEVGASINEALVRVSNLLSQVPDYPETSRQPVITTANSTGPPLAVLVVQSNPPGRSVAEYRTWVEEVIIPRFERIRGVANIRLIAGRPQEIHIDFDTSALAARKLTVGVVARAIQAELVDRSAGDLSMGKRRYIVRTDVAPADPTHLSRTVIGSGDDGTPILLRDVGTVTMGLRKPDAIGLINGSPSMALLFFREPGTNVLSVTEEIHEVTAELQRDVMAPEGLDLTVVSDQTEYIEGALDLVRNNLLLGGALAIIVLLLFLRSAGASAVVAVSIPVSIIGTALAMSLMGRTINIVSLAGMAFAVGMVVDNSIVVLENIDTWRRRESNVALASLEGAREVWGAILASTLTTAAVFIPIIAWKDEVGELLRDVAVAVSTSVFVSLVVSVVVIPSFAARLLRSRTTTGTGDPETATTGDLGRVGRAVHWVARSPARSIGFAASGIAAAAALGIGLLPPMEYLPTGNRNIVFGLVLPPPGYSVEEMERVGNTIQGRLVPHIGREIDGKPAVERTFFAGGPDQAFMGAVAVDPARVDDLAALLRGAASGIPDVIAFANKGSLFGRSLGGGRSIEIDISGSNLDEMTAFAMQLMGGIRAAMPEAQIRPIPGLDLGAPEFRVEPDRAQAAALGLSSSEIGLIVDAYVDGAIIGELGRAGEHKRDVLLRGANLRIDGPDALRAAPVATPRGEIVPLGRVAKITERLGPTIIQRIERRRALTLQVSPPDDIPFETAISRIREDVVGSMMREGKVPPGLRITYSGSAGKLDETKRRFGFVLLLAVVITYLLLSALFEDFLAPIAILVTVPLAGAGGILGLRLVDATLGPQPLDMMTAMGFVILIGVVVNNAILIVDGALSRMRYHQLSLEDAIASAVRWRVRPILMSAFTSLAGLAPLVLFPGSGSELYRGIGGVVLGGLAMSTVLSLFLVPAVFVVLWRLRYAASSS
jgi:HAE1 family hydrophobic/amphiphilic exporter-1